MDGDDLIPQPHTEAGALIFDRLDAGGADTHGAQKNIQAHAIAGCGHAEMQYLHQFDLRSEPPERLIRNVL